MDADQIGALLFAVAARAHRAGIDPEQALRQAARAYRDRVLHAETTTSGGAPPDAAQ